MTEILYQTIDITNHHYPQNETMEEYYERVSSAINDITSSYDFDTRANMSNVKINRKGDEVFIDVYVTQPNESKDETF